MDKKTKETITAVIGIIIVVSLLYFFIIPATTGEAFGFKWSEHGIYWFKETCNENKVCEVEFESHETCPEDCLIEEES